MFSFRSRRAASQRAATPRAWLTQAVLYYLSIAACLALGVNFTFTRGAVAAPTTFTVTNTNDSGAGSLRQALLDSIANPGRDNIHFNIPGAGVRTIHLLQALPFISDEVVINGYTQPGAQPNTLPEGSNAVLLIELDGSQAGLGADGLRLSYQSEVRGLVINGFKTDPGEGNAGGNGIVITGNNNRVAGCFIGTNATGTAAVPNQMNGVLILTNTGYNPVGGHDPADRNVLSGNGANGVVLMDTGVVVENNLIGTNAAGTGAVPNGQHGVLITAQAIYNGVNADAFAPGFTGNVIAFNGSDGVRVAPAGTLVPTSNRITGNSIFNNGGLGIDLEGDGPTPNDLNDTDAGANYRQNFPVITAATLTPLPGNQWQVTLAGTLNSSPSQDYSLHFYASLSSDTNSSGRKLIGSLNVTTVNGNASFNPTFTFSGLAGPTFKLTATATDERPTNDNSSTSEFSPPFVAQPLNGQVQFAQANTTVSETAGAATIHVTRMGGTAGTVTVDYAATNGSATAPQDFTAVNGTLTFNPGETSKSFTVPVVGDNLTEGDETVTLTLSNPTGGAIIGPPNPATLTIQDVPCPAITLTPATLPNGDTSTPYSAQIVANPAGAYTFTVTAGSLPPGFTLNANTGVLSGMPTASGQFAFTVTATNAQGCAGARAYQIQLICPQITLNPATLPNGGTTTPYSAQLVANPAGAYTCAVTSGRLPPGLTLNANTGLINGTPTASGTFPFTVTATNAQGCTGARAYQVQIQFICPQITLNPTPAPGTVPPVVLPNGITNTAYSTQVTASPAGAYSYAVTTNILPPGLTLNSATGVISGTPTAGGNFAFAITATGANGCTASQAYQILILTTCETITVNPATLAGGPLGTTFNQTITATGGAGPYTFTVASGALPTGLTLNANSGALSGTFTQAGSFVFTLKATGAGQCAGTRQYVMVVSCATLGFNPASLPNGRPGLAYTQTISVTPTANYTFSLLLGQLPPGLSLSSAGVLSGTPTQTGTFNFTVRAMMGSCSGTKAYALAITNTGAPAAASTAGAQLADYDGDGKTDLALWSAREGAWRIVRSSDQQSVTQSWGAAGDVTLAGDYDGDGKTDLAVFRPGTGTWLVKRSSDGGTLSRAWGAGYAPYFDVPVPGDYDRDGKTDCAVWRPSEGNWYVLRSSDQQSAVTAWGAGYAPYLDVPVPGDYDGDGKTDLAVFRRASGTWYIKRSSDGQVVMKAWGLGTDVPVAGDYDGDGKCDIAVWRGAESVWYIWQSATNSARELAWGTSAAPYHDVAAPGDYNGDGQADVAVWRAADSTWYIKHSGANTVLTQPLGQTGDRPIASRAP